MKQQSWRAVAVIVLAGALGAPAVAGAQPLPGPRTATMTVSGEGSVTQAPDRAVVAFRIENTDEAAARATSQNNSTANALVNRLAPLGISGPAIKTSGYGIDYNPRPPKPDPSSGARYGYTVARTVTVTVDNVGQVGAVVDAAVAAGVTNVNGISFGLKDQRGALRTAEAAAFNDADAQARALAGAAHVRLGRILHISPSGRLQPPQPLGRFAAPQLAAAGVPTTIDPGNLTVNATVSVEYELQP